MCIVILHYEIKRPTLCHCSASSQCCIMWVPWITKFLFTFSENGGTQRGQLRWSLTATPVVTCHEGRQIPCDHLVTVVSLLQALMLLMVISGLPDLLTAWYSVLHFSSNHSDINANVIENQIKHERPCAHVVKHFYRLCNCMRIQRFDGLY